MKDSDAPVVAGVPAWVLAVFILVALALGWWVGSRPSAPAQKGHEEHGEHEEHEEHPEGEVELSAEQISRAGIVLETVRLGPAQASFQATGSLAADPDREVHVTAQVAGRVLEVLVTEGQQVKAGQGLVVLDSPELARARADYQRALVETALAERELGRRTSLALVGDETRRQMEEARVDVTRAESALASARAREEVASRRLVRVEELLEDGIASAQQHEEARGALREAQADVRQYQSELAAARSHLEREETIQKQGLVANREVGEAQAAAARARADVRHARDVVVAMGAVAEAQGASTTLTAPIDGIVTARTVTRGETVDQGAALLTLLDPSRLWLWIAVPESQAEALREARSVELKVEKKSYRGRITYVDPQLDPQTRSLRARVELENAGGRLRPNMFAQVSLLGPGQGQAITVPAGALQTVEGQEVVYVAEEPGHFRRTPVKLGSASEERVVILEGLQPGERVVTAGAFFVKSEDQRGALGEGHSH
ncbi:efflux RND transporter periplasmic adaptor subunit [bacterium CPR1]|nr:efflux RND transporter periplasmic adaptor subunit [bacterium CPR1]